MEKKVTQVMHLLYTWVYMWMFFTLNRSFYPSTSSTTSVRADSSILDRDTFYGHKTTPKRYYVVDV